MITRHATLRDTQSWATYSDCETYRYALTREWDSAERRLVYIMLNPSKATEAQNDPTIERCERRARALGFGSFRAVNLFALRETDPAVMRAHPAPEGPDNDAALQDAAQWGDVILCAWGVHGTHRGAGDHTAQLLAARHPLWVLGLTKDGFPRHPLYLRYGLAPQPWSGTR